MRPHRLRPLAALAAATGALACAAAAQAVISQPLDPPFPVVHLPEQADGRTDGNAGDGLGWDISTGDVNGDGTGDTVIGSQGDYVQVVFGQLPPDVGTPEAPGAPGFRIVGNGVGTLAEVVGDVNGDGLEDIVVKGPADELYLLVPGKADGAIVDLDALAGSGFPGLVQFRSKDDGTGGTVSVHRLGDATGDGLDDVLFFDSAVGKGRAYVVFGKRDTRAVTLDDLGRGGYRVVAGKGRRIDAASDAGDVNGDGRADLAVSDRLCNSSETGCVWIVFGRDDTSDVDLDGLGAGGYRIKGGSGFDRMGDELANVGDVNGDGVPDLAIGSHTLPVYVVWGQRGFRDRTLTLKPGIFPGYAIDAGDTADPLDYRLAGGGDLNGDGLAELVIGDYGSSNNAAWVVYGKRTRQDVTLDTPGIGVRIDGPRSTRFGQAMAFRRTASQADLLVGAWRDDQDGLVDSGSVYRVDADVPASFAPVEDVRFSAEETRFVAAPTAQGPTLGFTALEPLRVRLAVLKLQPGKRVGAQGRCVPGTPGKGQRACIARRRVGGAAFAVRTAGPVSKPVRATFAPGTYALTVTVSRADGTTVGPFRTVFRVQ